MAPMQNQVDDHEARIRKLEENAGTVDKDVQEQRSGETPVRGEAEQVSEGETESGDDATTRSASSKATRHK